MYIIDNKPKKTEAQKARDVCMMFMIALVIATGIAALIA